ncbi:DUF1826 domain-containing protein [Rubellimicrobium sp. CFH 75288]|nr:DUF1826 domain-containing protein [Rubellimicrobium sp. CFH 75288]
MHRDRRGAAAVWRRGLPEALGPWLDALPPGRLPRFWARLGVPQVGAAVDAACGIAGLAPGAERRGLAADLGALAVVFGRLTGTAAVDVRLEAIATDAWPSLPCRSRAGAASVHPARAGDRAGLARAGRHSAPPRSGAGRPGADRSPRGTPG